MNFNFNQGVVSTFNVPRCATALGPGPHSGYLAELDSTLVYRPILLVSKTNRGRNSLPVEIGFGCEARRGNRNCVKWLLGTHGQRPGVTVGMPWLVRPLR